MTDLDRTTVTFEQAEGLEPLPTQLKPRELTQRLRASLWYVLHEHLQGSASRIDWTVGPPWKSILHAVHVFRFGLPTDEFDPKFFAQIDWLKPIIFEGSYADVFGLLQSLLRTQYCPPSFAKGIASVLEMNQAGFRLIGDTFIPVASKEEAEVAKRAFDALSSNAFPGAREHLEKAAERLSSGDPAGGVREAMQTVESVARVITKQSNFGDALKVLEQRWNIHPALKAAFSKLYGYSSDQQGIRHPLLEDANASVDEAEALFMFGACAAFVSYLIGKAGSTTD